MNVIISKDKNFKDLVHVIRGQLTKEEAKKLLIKKLPFVFTEIGGYMLATTLNGDVATEQERNL